MESKLEARFDKAMMDVYRRALGSVTTMPRAFCRCCMSIGIRTAQLLLHASDVSEGYVALWQRQRLDLTIEALILAPVWCRADRERGNPRSPLLRASLRGFRPRGSTAREIWKLMEPPANDNAKAMFAYGSRG